MRSPANTLELLGGCLCLDFANTADWRDADCLMDGLSYYTDLLDWSQHAGGLTVESIQPLHAKADCHPNEAQLVFERAIRLRQAIHGVFLAIAHTQPPVPKDLKTLNVELSLALPQLQVTTHPGGFELDWIGSEERLDSVLWAVVWSAAQMLSGGELSRVRVCAGKDCGWMFLDTSRNRSRRWCDMKECGNRAKAHRHYQRKQSIAE